MARRAPRGFTLVELLAALLILSLLALMSYRALGAVLDTRDHLRDEAAKWRRAEGFFAHFESDLRLAAPRPARNAAVAAGAADAAPLPAWRGGADTRGAYTEFSRFAAAEDVDLPRRVAYRLNERNEIELWLWPAADAAPGTAPSRYTALAGVGRFEVHYLNAALVWVDAWPGSTADAPLPRAVRVRVVLDTGEDIVRIFAIAA